MIDSVAWVIAPSIFSTSSAESPTPVLIKRVRRKEKAEELTPGLRAGPDKRLVVKVCQPAGSPYTIRTFLSDATISLPLASRRFTDLRRRDMTLTTLSGVGGSTLSRIIVILPS